MPQISSFRGIRVTMYHKDHPPPHFHVRYAGQKAIITIDSPKIWAGSIPPTQFNLIKDWAIENQKILRKNWNLARQQQPLEQIPGIN
jgi:hypothetical protein